MSNIDKQALREAADAANKASWGRWESYHPHKGARGYEVKVGVKAIAQHCLKVDSVFIAAANPATVLALLDELEAKEKRIAELSHHLQSAHAFIEHTEAFGREASNGILCCGDAQWNIDESKSALTAAGKGE
ncbi:ead/Ea22-like family protein [Citrobacter cronae]|nr:ead/Ea22-like family protein [Escherichia coli]